MSIGGSIFLIALGLILALAVEVDVQGLNIQLIGWILVLVGLVWLLLTLFLFMPRRRAAAAAADDVQAGSQVYDDRPPV